MKHNGQYETVPEGAKACPAVDDAMRDGGVSPAGISPRGGESFCGVAAAVAILGDAWTLLLVRDLAYGPRRFGELQSSTGMSPRVLTDRLRAMGATRLITRRMYAEIPPRVEYTLTEKGQDAVAVVGSLRAYGEKWLRPV
jgi:DNA-binding HxlR family transcriptional regulator